MFPAVGLPKELELEKIREASRKLLASTKRKMEEMADAERKKRRGS